MIDNVLSAVEVRELNGLLDARQIKSGVPCHRWCRRSAARATLEPLLSLSVPAASRCTTAVAGMQVLV